LTGWGSNTRLHSNSSSRCECRLTTKHKPKCRCRDRRSRWNRLLSKRRRYERRGGRGRKEDCRVDEHWPVHGGHVLMYLATDTELDQQTSIGKGAI
jgi:hypothetical protein